MRLYISRFFLVVAVIVGVGCQKSYIKNNSQWVSVDLNEVIVFSSDYKTNIIGIGIPANLTFINGNNLSVVAAENNFNLLSNKRFSYLPAIYKTHNSDGSVQLVAHTKSVLDHYRYGIDHYFFPTNLDLRDENYSYRLSLFIEYNNVFNRVDVDLREALLAQEKSGLPPSSVVTAKQLLEVEEQPYLISNPISLGGGIVGVALPAKLFYREYIVAKPVVLDTRFQNGIGYNITIYEFMSGIEEVNADVITPSVIGQSSIDDKIWQQVVFEQYVTALPMYDNSYFFLDLQQLDLKLNKKYRIQMEINLLNHDFVEVYNLDDIAPLVNFSNLNNAIDGLSVTPNVASGIQAIAVRFNTNSNYKCSDFSSRVITKNMGLQRILAKKEVGDITAVEKQLCEFYFIDNGIDNYLVEIVSYKNGLLLAQLEMGSVDGE